jgi:hypothetical protein
VAPISFFLLTTLLVGGLGIFRYQEVASLARDASRYAAVHGSKYAAATGNQAATPDDGKWSGGTGKCSLVYNNIIAPRAVMLDLSKLSYSVTWNTNNSQFHTATVSGSTVNVANTVSVTVSYRWIPEAYLGGLTLTSTSVMVMSF